MKQNGRFRLLLIILIPILFGLLLDLKPRPVKVDALWLTFKNAQKRQDHPAVLAAYHQIKQVMPWRTSEAKSIAQASFQVKDWQGVVDAYQLVDTEDKNRQDLYQLAEAYWQLGDDEFAKAIWDKIRILPDNAVADFRQLVFVQQQHQDWLGAYQSLLSWQMNHPQDNSLYYELGLSQILYDPENAMHALTRSLEVQPNLIDKVKNLQTGLPTLLKEENPAMRLMYAGNLLSQQNEWGYAAAAYDLVIGVVPDYAEAWALYSNVLYYLGEDGEDALQTAQELDKNAILVQAISAYDLRRDGFYEDSLGIWVRLSQREPQNALWLYEGGITHALAGDLESALTAYQMAAKINENDPYYWRELARFCLDYSVGLDSIGLTAARRALSLDPSSSESNDLMGWIFFTLGDMTSAERFLLKAQSLAPYSAVVHLHLGQVYIKQEKLEAAGENLQKSIRFAQNPQVKEQAEWLLLDFVKN